MSLEPLERPAGDDREPAGGPVPGESHRRLASAASVRLDDALRADAAMARDLLTTAMPDALLGVLPDPALARVLETLIQRHSMGTEEYLSAQTMLGILASGHGTLDEPWEVLLCADENDILALLGKQSTGHEVVESPDGWICHVHQCTDGSVAAFTLLAA